MTRKRFEICPASELEPDERRIETLGRFSVGVFNIDGEYYAMKNDCPHQRAPLCRGKLTGTNTSEKAGEYNWERDGQIIACPWHGWEFDITTGGSVFDPHKTKAKTFDTVIEESEVSVDRTATSYSGERTASAEAATDGGCENCGFDTARRESPIETYDVEVERGTVVVYL